MISHIRDWVLEREVETSVLASTLERAQLAGALEGGLGLSPCEEASSHDPEGPASEGGERLDAKGAGLRLCGVQEGIELQVLLGEREEGESWLLLRLARGLP